MSRRLASAYAPLPYPGLRHWTAFVQDDMDVVTMRRAGDSWSVCEGSGREPLDVWLGRRSAVPQSERQPLLCYGSNACPAKVVDLRRRFSLPGPVVMTPCTVEGLAAAWCAGTRAVDDSVPATLVPHAGTERHFVWWVAGDQWPALDQCEGRAGTPADRYSLLALDPASVADDGGRPLPRVLAYVGTAAERRPLRDASGRTLLVRDVPQAEARRALLEASP